MAPHSEDVQNPPIPGEDPATTVTNVAMNTKKGMPLKFPSAPKFTDKLEERNYLKGRLAAAFRIFGKNGYDEGVAGHITVRVSSFPFADYRDHG